MRLFRRVIFLAATYLAITAARTVAQDPGTPGPDDYYVAWVTQTRQAALVLDTPDRWVNLSNCRLFQGSPKIDVSCSSWSDLPEDVHFGTSDTWWTTFDPDGAPVMTFVFGSDASGHERQCRETAAAPSHDGWTCRQGGPRGPTGHQS